MAADVVVFEAHAEVLMSRYAPPRADAEVCGDFAVGGGARDAVIEVDRRLVRVHAGVDEEFCLVRSARLRRGHDDRAAAGARARRSRCVAHERRNARKVLAEDIAARERLATHREGAHRARITQREVIAAFVVRARVRRVVDHASPQREAATEGRSPAEARHRAACSDTVAEHPLIAAPVAEHVPVVHEAVLMTECTYQPFCHSEASKVRSNHHHDSGKSMPTERAALPSR